MSLAILRLKAQADRRLRSGHLWVYSNEVDTKLSPLTQFSQGQAVIIESAQGKALGIALMAPNQLVCARLYSRDIEHPFDKSLLVHRLNIAASLRDAIYPSPFYRLVNAEADFLPGIEIDRFGDYFVVQLSTQAMEQHKALLLEAIVQVFKPEAVLWRHDLPNRDWEELPRYVETAYGEFPEALRVEENGLDFVTHALEKKKASWQFDLQSSRQQLAQWVTDRRVLCLYADTGAWPITAAIAGAESVVALEAGELATDLLLENAEQHQVQEIVQCLQGEVLEGLQSLKAEEQRFDLVIIDPPAFIKRKKDLKTGEAGYRKLYEGAMRLLNRDGLLLVNSRSPFFNEEQMQAALLASARHLDRNLQVLQVSGASPCYPSHPAINESRVLKTMVCRVLPTS